MMRARRRARKLRSSAGRRRHLLRWVGITAGVVVLAGGGYLIGHGDQSPPAVTDLIVSRSSAGTQSSTASLGKSRTPPPASAARSTTALAVRTTAPSVVSTVAAVPSVVRKSIDVGSATAGLTVPVTLTVNSDPVAGYRRSAFGSAWTDDVTVPGGHNGCDKRHPAARLDRPGDQAGQQRLFGAVGNAGRSGHRQVGRLPEGRPA